MMANRKHIKDHGSARLLCACHHHDDRKAGRRQHCGSEQHLHDHLDELLAETSATIAGVPAMPKLAERQERRRTVR